jgi:hypothetical protein
LTWLTLRRILNKKTMTTEIVAVGCDYSITSPALCVFNGDPKNFGFSNCQVYSLTSNKKAEGGAKNITVTPYPVYSDNIDRYDAISDWALKIIAPLKTPVVYLEGYAFAAKGLVFNIAENTGLLKYKLRLADVPMEVFQPSAVKKTATGKGNANKALMEESFKEREGRDIKAELGVKPNQDNPSSDIIDSYYILRHGLLTKGVI